MLTISFDEFKNYLAPFGYRDYEIESLFKSVTEMDSESRAWFINWFKTGELPSVIIEGKSIKLLIDEYHMTPVNAFITFDWFKNEPELASLYFMDVNPRIGSDFSSEAEKNQNPASGEKTAESDDAHLEDSITAD